MTPEPSVANKIEHIRLKSQDAAGQLLNAGRQGKTELFHMLVCDANDSPPFSCEHLVCPLLPLLKRSSPIVLTLKVRRRRA
jgi:hypothetical protein